LFATTDESVLQFNPAAKVPQGWGEIRASVVTPPLRSPAKGPQKWIRIEATVELPPGCSLEISWAAAGDEARHTSTYHGGPADTGRKSMILSAPLHDVQAESITVEVSLTAAPGGGLPALSDLSVLYPGPTLVEHLPAIYRSRELESGDVLRGLVGVLEAGTQQLDASIGDLGRNIHPDTADADWLDYVASWLGLPWDNALTIEQKRRLVGHASAIAEGYGTRAGLEALLDSLFPQQPRGFRIVDATVDYGLATVAGEGCEGSRLPAMLGGYPNSATVLGTRAILGKACLPGDDQEGETARLLGKIRIDIEASAEERKAWEPWLKGVIDAMLPAAAQSELRWLLKGGLSAARVGDDARLEADPEAHLGTDAVTGKARLGGRRRTVVPDRLTRNSTLQ
jgi:phage tail-like protein